MGTHLSPEATGSADSHDQDISTSIELLQSMQQVRMEFLSTHGVSGTSGDIERVNIQIEETPVRIPGTRKDEKRETHADMEIDVKWEEGMNKIEQGNVCPKGQTESKLKIPRLNLTNCKAVTLA